MIPPDIVFLHNAKAGGSSIQAMIATLYPPGSIAPRFGDSPFERERAAATLDDHAGHAFYAGHWGHDFKDRLAPGHALITNVRDPVARVVSVYRYWQLSGNPYRRLPPDEEPAALAGAYAAVAGSLWLFVAEDPKGSMRLFRTCHAAFAKAELPRVNVSGGDPVTVSAADRAYILERNLLDAAVACYATRVHRQRLAALGLPPARIAA